MTRQGDSKPPKTSYTSRRALPSGEEEKTRLGNNPAEETPEFSKEPKKLFLNHREAMAGGPADGAACGEEDPGVALELLVEDAGRTNNR